ncbi:universal stress protein [Variovorax sp. JS1663]|uniref:universal stress protein n=1 Tax=Variovorax sp. JS1663 TaxID=1851577 RepID=UPI000B3484E3|nr:universal stress protein [Variovorax sp. JS1663]OUM00929.1 universal stress protein UspA [Variovorax sp. JS1663]
MYQRILVPIDGSTTSKRGLEEAIALAKLTQGRLRLFHVIDELSFALSMDAYAGHAGDWLNMLRENGRRLLADGRDAAQAAGVEVEAQLCDTFSSSVHQLVVDEATRWPAELIVLGTHGRRGVGRVIMGSSAEQILRYSPVPVLLVRAPEAEKKTAPDEAKRVSLPVGALAYE